MLIFDATIDNVKDGERFTVNEFVYGSKDRIFLNTNIGCRAKCAYCYLPDLGIGHEKKRISAEEVIDMVDKSGLFVAGELGSIISLGCYSECMDEINIEDTIKLILFFSKSDNYIQVATKKEMDISFFVQLLNNHVDLKKIYIYISMPCITDAHRLEPGTSGIDERISNIELCKKHNVPVVLYVKPFLEDVTYKDVNRYIELVKRYDIPLVVGERLDTEVNENKRLVGEKRLFGCESKLMDEFVAEMKKYTKVYTHSTDYIEAVRY